MIIAIKLSVICICVCGGTFGICKLAWAQNNQVISDIDQPAEVTKTRLKGNVQEADSVEAAKEGDNDNKTSLVPAGPDASSYAAGRLNGYAQAGDMEPAKTDPDADDKELMIAWDKWRNRFLQAVLGSTTEMLNNGQASSFKINPYTHTMEAIYPIGTTAWFVCEVTRDRQIKRLRILNSSGYPEYDKAVLEAVQALQNSSLLRFPTGSKRTAILQGGAVERAVQPQQQYFRFGDVERYRVPAY